MNQEALDLWTRACRSYQTASLLAGVDPDAAASRAYYAAFYAASALFALQGTSFTKHAALEAAVHRDLVKAGTWSEQLGSAFSWLVGLRKTGDYGMGIHVSPEEAEEAVRKAGQILQTVRESGPEPFPTIEAS